MVDDILTIECISWQQGRQLLAPIRHQVFVREQGVPEEDEWDEADETAVHFLATLDRNDPVACARLLPNGKIGRMAVLADFRHQGIGTSLLNQVIDYARRHNYGDLFLDAQIQALEFYTRLGFVAEGDEFQDAGIAHRRMRLVTDQSSTASDTGVIRLAGGTECLEALQNQTANARQRIDILSDHLNPALYSNAELMANISALARRSRRSRVRILLRETKPLHGRSHPLVQLAQRLPSRVELRGLSETPQKPDIGYCIVDRQSLVYFNQEAELSGFCNADARAETQHLLEEFDHLWNHYSFTDPNLKNFYL